jgi:hypothetical protein
MDISQFEVRVPTISDLNQQISECIKKEVRKQIDSFLHRVAQGEDMSYDMLKDKYLKSTEIDTVSISKEPKKRINDEEQCHARVSTGKRCSRRCKGSDDYCGGHLNARPYGQI